MPKPTNEQVKLARETAWLPVGSPIPDGVPIDRTLDRRSRVEEARSWAVKILRRSSLYSISESVPQLTKTDLYQLVDVCPDNHWSYVFDVKLVDTLPVVADTESAADEWDIQESNEAIDKDRPWGKTSYDKKTHTWHVTISREAGEMPNGIRYVFWHEFGHTLPPQIIASVIGTRTTESEGEYHNRFAGGMAGMDPSDFAVKTGDGRGNWGHTGRLNHVGGSGPPRGDGRLRLPGIDVPMGGKAIDALVQWGDSGDASEYSQSLIDLSSETGDPTFSERSSKITNVKGVLG